MIPETDILQALESLAQHKLRTFLTLLGMIFGVGAVIAMLSVGKGAEKEALKLIDSMGLRNIIVKAKEYDENRLKEIREKSPGLTKRDLEAAIETLPFLSSSCSTKNIPAYSIYSEFSKADANVMGVSLNYTHLANLHLQKGRFFTSIDNSHFSQVCIIGKEVSKNLFRENEALGNYLKINHVWLKVIGVLEDKTMSKDEFQGIKLKGDQNTIFIPLETALKKFKFKALDNEIDEFRIQLKKGVDSYTAASTLEHLLKRRHKETDDYEMIVPESLLEQHKKTQRIFTIVMACVAGISLLVGGIGIMNIMLATVLERTREIGLRMAIGARQSDIKKQFIMETFTVSALGGILGIFFGYFMALIISLFAGWPVSWSIFGIFLSVGVCSIIGIVFGIYPAVQASRLDPIEALRHD